MAIPAGRQDRVPALDLRRIARNVAMFQINRSCNYHCYYCLASVDGIIEDERPPVGNETFQAFWRRTGRAWWFVISGGESFLYPGFADLCARLASDGHFLSVDTNLSRDLEEFLRLVAPEAVVMMSCAYHPEAERKPGARRLFQERVCRLADSGFRVCIPYVMHPRRFDDYRTAREEFGALGFRLTPQPFRGEYGERRYPEAYTEEQRAFIAVELDRPLLFALPPYRGKPCRAGHSLVRIMPDGRIYRCPGHKTKLGDMKSGTLGLFEEVRPCDRAACDCNRFVRQVDSIGGEPSMIDSFARDITINESRIRRIHG